MQHLTQASPRNSRESEYTFRHICVSSFDLHIHGTLVAPWQGASLLWDDDASCFNCSVVHF